MRDETTERRLAADRATRLDLLATALLLGLAALEVLSAVSALARGPDLVLPELFPARVPLLSAAGGLIAAAVLMVLAVGRARRAPWSRPAAIASLVVLIGLLVIGGGSSPDLARVALPLACLAMLLVVLQRRGHVVASVMSPEFARGAALAVIFSAALLVQRLFA